MQNKSRRTFVCGLVGLTAKAGRPITGSFVNDAFPAGHRIRDHAKFAAPPRTERTSVAIVGGGMAGLSAAWRLQKRGLKDFVLLEMEKQPGGNSRWGENEISAYPWAAHYLPVPGPKATLVRELCQDLAYCRTANGTSAPSASPLRSACSCTGAGRKAWSPTSAPALRSAKISAVSTN
jgi:hypothetical protein